MPPQPGAARKRQNGNMYFEPGVRGRKTGLTVPDTGIRDEMGMEPIDDLFSSPEKTVVMAMAPPPSSVPAMTAAVASARKPPPAKTPKVAHKTPKLKPQPRVEAQAPVQRTEQKAPEQQPQHQDHDGAGHIPTADQTNSMEESMQIGNSTMPEPTAVLTERRKSTYIPPPKSKSPTKTFLGSPARRHPSIQPISSPTRGDIQAGAQKIDKEPVARKLNFSNGDDVFRQPRMDAPKPAPNVPKSPAPAQVMQKPTMKTPSTTNGKRKRISLEKENVIAPEDIPAPDSVRSMPGAWEEPTPFPSQKKVDRSFDLSPSNNGEDEYMPQPMDIDGDVEMEEVNYETILEKTATPEPESARPIIATIVAKKGKARTSVEKDKRKGKEVVFPDPEKKKLGRPKSKEKEQEKEATTIPMKQAEQYLEIEASRIYSEDEAPGLPPAKKSKLSSKDVNRKISIKKAAQLAKDVESSPVQIQRGPPRPRQNGLFILRRETPALSSFPAARVGLGLGRGMVKPSAYWRNEDEEGDTIYEPAAQQPSRRDEPSSPPQNNGKRIRREIEEEIEEELNLAEAWEAEPGRINGLVKEWNAADKSGDAVMERDDEIALSGPAIFTRPIPGSDVQFAKTLTLPFFGSGMVDLPPGAIKKPKNSRKMQMVFFVHKGNVKVTVNGNEFRISSGGMWQVPRGNFYSIENDYDKEARIFFSQGCEIRAELE